MATIDDWILHSTGSFLTEEPVADESKYAPELQRQYTQITGIDPYAGGVQEFKEGGLEKWNSYGLGSPLNNKNWFEDMGTAENLAKFGYTAPNVTHEQLVARDLADEYGQYTKSVGANDATARADAISSITQEWDTVRDSSSGSKAFLEKYGLNEAPYTHDLWNTDDQIAAAGGYSATTPKSQDDYYGDKYGRNFNDQQIEGAVTGRYGELQGPQDLGKGWEELYQSMDKWRQQDEMWYQAATGEQGELFPRAIAHQKAAMAAGGLKSGTALWNQNIDRLNNQRLDIEGTYQQKQDALRGSQTYQALERQYNDMRDTTQKRAKETTRTRYQDEVISHEATQKWQGARYGYDSETGQQYVITPGQWVETPAYNEVIQTPYEETYMKETDTGDLLYGENGQLPSFDEFWQQNFSGAQDVENPYTSNTISNQPESDEDRRARMAASGQVME